MNVTSGAIIVRPLPLPLSGFTDVTASVVPGLPEVWLSSVEWADYDNDGRLDFLLTGSGVAQL